MTLLFLNLAAFAGLFVLAKAVSSRMSPASRHWMLGTTAAAGLPAMAYALYYLHLFDDWAAFYAFRSHELSNFAPSLLGVLMGAAWPLGHSMRWKVYPTMAGLGVVALPFVKISLGAPDLPNLQDRWSGGVCLQTSPATCGHASLATLLAARFKDRVTEREIAEAARSTQSGTEVWYLAQYLRRKGYQVRFITRSGNVLPDSIAGTRVHGVGHFIAVIADPAGELRIADPLRGAFSQPQAKDISFTGFYMEVHR